MSELTGKEEVPVLSCESQHDHVKLDKGIMIHVEELTFFEARKADGNEFYHMRLFLNKQEKFGMRQDGRHGDNARRKKVSVAVGKALARICGYHDLLRWFETAASGVEIDDAWDAINLALAGGIELVAMEAKNRDATAQPHVLGCSLQSLTEGSTEIPYVRVTGVDPGTRYYARTILDVAAVIYPPRTGKFLINVEEPTADIDWVIPTYRVLLVQIIDLKDDRIIMEYTRDPTTTPFYAPVLDGSVPDATSLIAAAKEAKLAATRAKRAATLASKKRQREEDEAAGRIPPKVKKPRAPRKPKQQAAPAFPESIDDESTDEVFIITPLSKKQKL
jgi:hypothetical protein